MKIKKIGLLRPRGADAVWVYQIFDDRYMAVRYLRKKREFDAIETGAIPFKAVGLPACPVIISLPRNKLTMRYLKNVPAQAAAEIENIVALQAPQFLPYPAQELITAYQVVSGGKSGYTELNLVVAHKDTIERCLLMFPQAGRSISVLAGSWGLLNYYNFLRPQDDETTIIIDADRSQPELAVVSGRKLLFSRSFRVDAAKASWQDEFCVEVNKSRSAYLKDTALLAPVKIVVLGSSSLAQDFADILKPKVDLPVAVLSYERIKFAAGLMDKANAAESSLVSLLGLAIKDTSATLELLPAELKVEKKKASQKNELLRLALSFCGIIMILGLGVARNLENKSRYLGLLESRLGQVSQEAKPLEEMERKLKTMEVRRQNGPGGLDALHELYRIIPPELTLTMFGYEDAGSVTIRGRCPELNAVFSLVTELEKSALFSGFPPKMQYASKKELAGVESIDFEIICRQEK